MAPARRKSPRPRGFTIVEAMVAALVVGLMTAASLAALQATARLRLQGLEQRTALRLCEMLMSEIQSQAYEDANAGTRVFGLETGESAVDRTTMDDVDDYKGYTQTPPTLRDGTAIENVAGWALTADVAWVTATTPETPVLTDTGIKRVVVCAKRGTRVVLTLEAFRTRAWDAGKP